MKTVLIAALFTLSLAAVPAAIPGTATRAAQPDRLAYDVDLDHGTAARIRPRLAETEASQPGRAYAETEALQPGRAYADARETQAVNGMFIPSADFAAVNWRA